jgi:hypothetical protein
LCKIAAILDDASTFELWDFLSQTSLFFVTISRREISFGEKISIQVEAPDKHFT